MKTKLVKFIGLWASLTLIPTLVAQSASPVESAKADTPTVMEAFNVSEIGDSGFFIKKRSGISRGEVVLVECVITHVEKGSLAEKAGIKAGMEIVVIDDVPIRGMKMGEFKDRFINGDGSVARRTVYYVRTDSKSHVVKIPARIGDNPPDVEINLYIERNSGTVARAEVAKVVEGSLAYKAGIRKGFEIVSISGVAVVGSDRVKLEALAESRNPNGTIFVVKAPNFIRLVSNALHSEGFYRKRPLNEVATVSR